ncbi:MAG: LacI family DNA-binding transcriptional regulator [Chloroflexi bacterium]|nr:LacI family DNA-binding transcriptional regulator [Chloroflexota bacterium]
MTQSDEYQARTDTSWDGEVDRQARRGGGARQRRITHRDVAEHAGVSPAVVSYVVNGGPRGTSATTRARVLRAIEELGYRPLAAARGLRMQRTYTVGFVDGDYAPFDVYLSPYSAGILTGLTAELSQHNYYLLISPVQIGQDLGALQDLLWSGRLDGAVVRLVEDSPAAAALLDTIAAAGVPCVCIERPADSRLGMVSVTIDDAAGAFEATRALVERGHRRIAHLSGDERYASARSRREGYVQALTDSGLDIDTALIQGGSWAPFAVDAALGRLLALPDPPTAIFAASDSLAFRAVEMLRVDGRRVPDDVAVVGFDDIPLAREMVPPLSTVQIPLAELGQRAAQHLLALIDRKARVPMTDVLPVQVVHRGTA